MQKITVILADDHTVVRQGLRALLDAEEDMHVVGEADNGRQAVQISQRLRPDVVVMDIGMPSLNGLEATRQIRRAMPRTEVLVLTFDESEEPIREVLLAGASGYLFKNDVSRVLVQAVEHLSHHRPFFTSRVSELLLKEYRGRDEGPAESPSSWVPLSPREREVVQLVAEGKSSKAVAEALGISVKTVDNHRANIMRKLGLHSVSEWVRYAIRNKIIAP